MTAREMEQRLRFLSYFVIVVFTALFFRLWYLQIMQGAVFAERARTNSMRRVVITAPRGIFYDRNGKRLVDSRLAFSVSVIPRELPRDHLEIFRKLGRILGMDPREIEQAVSNPNNMPYYPVRLKRDVDAKTVTLVEESRLDLPGVIVEELPVRDYIYGRYAAHLFGYLGNISGKEYEYYKNYGYMASDVIGKTGLERDFEEYLRGVDGGQQVEVNKVNRPIRVLGEVEPIPGDNLVLTLDSHVQQVAEEALDQQLDWIRKNTPYKNARAGAVIALIPKTGEILAFASRPDFDPNRFVGGVPAEYWEELSKDPYHPFTNRVTQAAFPPGSTFKAVTGIAALEEGKTTANEYFYDINGRDSVYPQKTDWGLADGIFHGKQTIVEGLQNSCNIVFYELGRRVGINRLAYWARELGLGQPTGLKLTPTERYGTVPDEEWKRKQFTRPDNKIWYPIETLDVAIGQGALEVTPIQLANLYATIANGGTAYRPFVVKEITSRDGRVIKRFRSEVLRRVRLKPQTVAIIKEGLSKVVGEGTAAYAFRGFPLPVAGKTGTAEIAKGVRDVHAWFAAFAPIDDPQIVVVTMVERGGHGGSSAAPVARKVMEAFFGLDKPKETSQEAPGGKPGNSQPANPFQASPNQAPAGPAIAPQVTPAAPSQAAPATPPQVAPTAPPATAPAGNAGQPPANIENSATGAEKPAPANP